MTLLKEFNQSFINYYVKPYALKMSKKKQIQEESGHLKTNAPIGA